MKLTKDRSSVCGRNFPLIQHVQYSQWNRDNQTCCLFWLFFSTPSSGLSGRNRPIRFVPWTRTGRAEQTAHRQRPAFRRRSGTLWHCRWDQHTVMFELTIKSVKESVINRCDQLSSAVLYLVTWRPLLVVLGTHSSYNQLSRSPPPSAGRQ